MFFYMLVCRIYMIILPVPIIENNDATYETNIDKTIDLNSTCSISSFIE